MNPLRSDADVRKLVTQSLDSSNSDIQKAIKRVSREAPDADTKDVASVGLSAMEGIQGDGKLAEYAARRAGKATLEVLRDKDFAGLDAQARMGEELTDPTRVYAPLLASTETVMRSLVGSSIPGPVSLALSMALDIGQELRKPGHTTTDHSAFNINSPHHSIGPGESFDFVGMSGVYHAAFSSVAMRKDVESAAEMASLGSSMLLYVDEGNRRYMEESGGYSKPPDTAQVVAREVFGRLGAEAPVWSKLGLKLADGGPGAEGCRSLLDYVADGKEANAVNLLAAGRLILPQVPEGRRDAVATSVLEAVSSLPEHGEAAGLLSKVRSGEWTPSQAVNEGLEAIGKERGDDWVLHGKQRAEAGTIGGNEGYVNVGGIKVKKRAEAAPAADEGGEAPPAPDQDRVRAAVEQMLNEQRALDEDDDDQNHPDLVAQRQRQAALKAEGGGASPASAEPQGAAQAQAPQGGPQVQAGDVRAQGAPQEQGGGQPQAQVGPQLQGGEQPQGRPQVQGGGQPQSRPQVQVGPQVQGGGKPQGRPQGAGQPQGGVQPGYDPSKFGANVAPTYDPRLFGAPGGVPFDPRLFGAPMPTAFPTDPTMGASDPRFQGMDPRTMDPRMAMDPRFQGMDPRMAMDPRFQGIDPRTMDPRIAMDPRFQGMDPRTMDPRFGPPGPNNWSYAAPNPGVYQFDPYPNGRPYSINTNAQQGPFVQQSRMSGWKIAAIAAGAAIGIPLLFGMIF